MAENDSIDVVVLDGGLTCRAVESWWWWWWWWVCMNEGKAEMEVGVSGHDEMK